MVPNPIFSAWRNPASQSVSGCIKWNLSHPHKSSCSCAVARQLLPCSIGAWMTISAHALSSATGSAEARMPRALGLAPGDELLAKAYAVGILNRFVPRGLLHKAVWQSLFALSR